MAKKSILSIDGGGIRGILPLCALIELERKVGKPSREIFSFIAGTSTGAIIAGALARGLSAETILDIYRELGPAVFRRDWLGFIFSLGSYKYRTAPLADFIRKQVGDPLLNDLPVDVMIASTRVTDGVNWYFVRDNPANARTTGELKQAAVEAFYYTPPGSYIEAETTMVSLGTGYYPKRTNPGNIIEWVKFIIGELLSAPGEQQTTLALRHFPRMRTHRWNPNLPFEVELDDVGAIDQLIELGREAASEFDWLGILTQTSSQFQVKPTALMVRNARQ
jgi:hypothetical protein